LLCGGVVFSVRGDVAAVGSGSAESDSAAGSADSERASAGESLDQCVCPTGAGVAFRACGG